MLHQANRPTYGFFGSPRAVGDVFAWKEALTSELALPWDQKLQLPRSQTTEGSFCNCPLTPNETRKLKLPWTGPEARLRVRNRYYQPGKKRSNSN